MLLTSLPLVFGEKFGLERRRIGGADPARSRATRCCRSRWPTPPACNGARLLLAAHPRAQPAEALVELDQWVRGGGRLLLLADPMLEWHSERPLGDRLRPPPGFADTGLLAHWGLRLDAPDDRGPDERSLAGAESWSPRRDGWSAAARSSADGLVARCAIGKGRATIIADADFLDERRGRGRDEPPTISTG